MPRRGFRPSRLGAAVMAMLALCLEFGLCFLMTYPQWFLDSLHPPLGVFSIHVWILLVVFQPIRKWYYRLVHMTGWLILFRFGKIRSRWGGCLCVVVLNGIRWCWHLINLNVWTTLYWFNGWSSAKWACWEFQGFITGWMGKVPFSLSFCGLANWVIWTSTLCIVCMRKS